MGSLFSRPRQPLPVAGPETQPQKEADTHPPSLTDGNYELYADFWAKVDCQPHADGQHVIIRALEEGPVETSREPIDWPIKKLHKVYKRLDGAECKRIVRHAGTQNDGAIVLERPEVGPLVRLTLPALEIEQKGDSLFTAQSKENGILLALYYRWALQALSALRFFHAHGIYVKVFTARNVWLRSDYSLAIVGIISAVVEGDPITQEEFGEGGWVGDEWIEYDLDIADNPYNTRTTGSIKEDLFNWATFVWRLMTNEHSDKAHWKRKELWEPVSPLKGGILTYTPDAYQILTARLQRNLYQRLDERRLGDVLVKAWTEAYNSIEEAIEDIQHIVQKQDLAVERDEVDIGEAWEDVFEVVGTGESVELKFRSDSADVEM
ncbi:hypothetical protein M011DRAFT_472602 [Sporormia fimetaria CBS 119925]|uniref:Protein kinase domain-containing protein n=1 Tax=Sporormia fimetaria CBS 119925 TaxID=1340428 RepID=A0A6A6UX22_9PLEO|nr:hypothetical protein M011DRAFT_472602 [Sporormia fimetaria CBS 119925]